MTNHRARVPGTINDPSTEKLTDRQAVRLAKVTGQPAASLTGKALADLRSLHVDPSLFASRTICGRVVKTDADGKDHPVPFATVNVYDTDLGLLGWSPAGQPYSWFFPLFTHRELLRTVTTDECGRFCVRVPRWELDWYLRWRLERKCYLTWLRRPSLRDVLERAQVIPRPGPDPSPLLLDEHVLRRAEHVLDARGVARLRRLGAAQLGEPEAKLTDALAAPAFAAQVRPPLDKKARALLGGDRGALARRLALNPAMLAKLDLTRCWGPYLRCTTVLVPEWHAVLDVPDLTFEVLQDVDGDGKQEVIYSEGLFDVRWDAGAIPDVTLHASQIAVTSSLCDTPDIPSGTGPGILFAGNYPLRQATAPDPDAFQDGTGMSVLVNPPDSDGDPGTAARNPPAQAPFTGSFYLFGSAEAAGATHYRVVHEVGAVSSYLTGGFGPLRRIKNGVLESLTVAPVAGHWYPIVPAADKWLPGGILAPVDAGDDDQHRFRLELGQASGGIITPVASSLTDPVRVWIDTTRPTVTASLEWRQPDASGPTSTWQALGLSSCPVIARATGQRVQFRFTVMVSAHHLRDFAVGASGCGSVKPVLIHNPDLPPPPPPATLPPEGHWHTSAGDNAATVVRYYELAAGAPAGCYHFAAHANSRAFDPRATVDLAPSQTPESWWQANEQAPIYTHADYAIAIQ